MRGKLARFSALRYGPAMSDDQNSTEETASFGFREVRAAEKASLVRGVFDSVASKYDVMNDAMSLFDPVFIPHKIFQFKVLTIIFAFVSCTKKISS